MPPKEKKALYDSLVKAGKIDKSKSVTEYSDDELLKLKGDDNSSDIGNEAATDGENKSETGNETIVESADKTILGTESKPKVEPPPAPKKEISDDELLVDYDVNKRYYFKDAEREQYQDAKGVWRYKHDKSECSYYENISVHQFLTYKRNGTIV